MKKEKNIAIYCCSAQDYKKLAERTDADGYSWGHNGKLSEWNPIENLSKNNPIVIYLNIITKRITYGWKIKPEHISVDEYLGCIKSEFHHDFKRIPVPVRITKGGMMTEVLVEKFHKVATNTSRRTFITIIRKYIKDDEAVTKMTGHTSTRQMLDYSMSTKIDEILPYLNNEFFNIKI